MKKRYIKQPEKCLIVDCENKSDSRGLCQRCYAAAHKYVKQGKTTWGQLTKLGMAQGEPTQSKNAFTRAFEKVFKFNK